MTMVSIFKAVGFKKGYFALGFVDGRIAKAAIYISLFISFEYGCCLLGRIEGVSAGGVNRCKVRPVAFTDMPTMDTD